MGAGFAEARSSGNRAISLRLGIASNHATDHSRIMITRIRGRGVASPGEARTAIKSAVECGVDPGARPAFRRGAYRRNRIL
jgi:hypothetical protein